MLQVKKARIFALKLSRDNLRSYDIYFPTMNNSEIESELLMIDSVNFKR